MEGILQANGSPGFVCIHNHIEKFLYHVVTTAGSSAGIIHAGINYLTMTLPSPAVEASRSRAV